MKLPINGLKVNCTGCGSCAQTCDLISMEEDNEGFSYPRLNSNKCLNCDKCYNTCPMRSHVGNVTRHIEGNIFNRLSHIEYPKVFAAWNNHSDIRENSSSGGIFTSLAYDIINNYGGAVAGSFLNDDLELKNILIESVDEIHKLRGSKYLQSNTNDIYSRVSYLLNKKQKILFVGTPCQVSGIKSFLNHNDDNLITIDLVCHGVPSYILFRKYIQYLELKYKSKVTTINFKFKNPDWMSYSVKVGFDNGTYYVSPKDDDIFIRLYLSNLFLRPSCYYCPYATIPRQSDITLGDFWGFDDLHPNIDHKLGVSLVMANNNKGYNILKKVSDELTIIDSNIDSAVRKNSCIIKPVSINHHRDYFMRIINKSTIETIYNIYLSKPLSLNYIIKQLNRLRHFADF